MDQIAKMEGNLEDIRAGAVGFKAVGRVAWGVGALLAGLALWQAAAGPGFVFQLSALGNIVVCFMVAWMATRASSAFDAVAALIVEMREIV